MSSAPARWTLLLRECVQLEWNKQGQGGQEYNEYNPRTQNITTQ